MDTLTIRPAAASEPDIANLIAAHFALMRAISPEESCHVMPADALAAGGAWMVAAEQGGTVLGIGALQVIGPGHGEIKSMHTASAARGRGVARRIVRALMTEARNRDLTRLSLETGSADLFAPARALYASEGFTDCPPFGAYVEDPHSVFMTRTL